VLATWPRFGGYEGADHADTAVSCVLSGLARVVEPLTNSSFQLLARRAGRD